jgi:hypothetical protein
MAWMVRKYISIWTQSSYNLNRTVDPGGIPSLSSTIGGPKHLELGLRSASQLHQSNASADKAERDPTEWVRPS